MSDDKPKSFAARMKEGATGLALAGALATGGCDRAPSTPPDPRTEATPDAPPGVRQQGPSEGMYKMFFEHGILDTYVIVDGQRLRLIDPSAEDNEKWEALVKADRPFNQLTLEFSDLSGHLETCSGNLNVPEQYRHTRYLPQLVTNESLVSNLLSFARQCEIEHPLSKPPSPEDYRDSWSSPAAEPEPVDPRTIASDDRALQGRIARDGAALNV